MQTDFVRFYSFFTDTIGVGCLFLLRVGQEMSELNREASIKAFASAASLLMEQYVLSERADWDDRFVLSASNTLDEKARKVS